MPEINLVKGNRLKNSKKIIENKIDKNETIKNPKYGEIVKELISKYL
jgi:hypothetical protein